MVCVITNIYNKKSKGPTLVELFTATGKLKKVFFLQLYMFGVCTAGDNGTHRYDIQVLATQASTWVHQYSSLLQWSVALGQRGLEGGSFAYCARNARCTVTTALLCDIPTHKTTSAPEQPFSHYINSHRLAAEMWTTMKNNLPFRGGGVWVVPSICSGFVNTCPTVFL